MFFHIVRRADAAFPETRLLGLGDNALRAVAALRQIFAPQIGAARNCVMRHQRVHGIGEKLKPLMPAPDRLAAVMMQREIRHQRDIGVDSMPDGHAFLGFDDVVINVGPGLGLFGINERKGQRAKAVARRNLDRVPIGAGDPHWRVRLLHRLWHHIAARHGEILPFETGIGIQHQHIGDLLRRLQAHAAFFLGGDAKAAQLQPGGAFADAKLDAAIRQQVHGRNHFGCARRVIIFRDHLTDSLSNADIFGLGGCEGQKNFRGRGVGIFLQKMMLHLPGVIKAQPVGQHHLLQRFVKQFMFIARVPRLG